ncbi:MliC family protein [Craterilacuibacter sp.]|uniref:MliC family protein n=1 Tax=Craterilacuibacter sp. TaxID=2870909 RepID=UPI003F3C2B8B
MKQYVSAVLFMISSAVWADASAPQPALESSAPLPVPVSPVVVVPARPLVIEAPLGSVPFRVEYRCSGAQEVSVLYPAYADAATQPIRLRWKGQQYRLSLAASGSGARYASSKLVWWTKGETAFLSTRGGRRLLRQCVAQQS